MYIILNQIYVIFVIRFENIEIHLEDIEMIFNG